MPAFIDVSGMVQEVDEVEEGKTSSEQNFAFQFNLDGRIADAPVVAYQRKSIVDSVEEEDIVTIHGVFIIDNGIITIKAITMTKFGPESNPPMRPATITVFGELIDSGKVSVKQYHAKKMNSFTMALKFDPTAARFKNVSKHLKKGKMVTITGQLEAQSTIAVLDIALIAHDSAPEPPTASELFSRMNLGTGLTPKKKRTFNIDGGKLENATESSSDDISMKDDEEEIEPFVPSTPKRRRGVKKI